MVLGRRVALGACVAAPLVGAAALSRGLRAALVGARGFGDSRADPGPFPKRFVDAAGSARELPAPPRRIVSTYLACEEVLPELVALDRVVGVSVYADDAGASNCLGVYPPRVTRVRAEPERVLALEPDLVCVAGFTDAEALRMLTGAGLPLLRWSRFDSFAQVLDGIRLLGAALGEEARAAALAAGVERELAEVARRIAGTRPLRVLYYDTPGYTDGAGTLVDEIITRAGGRNVAAEIGIRGPGQIGLEMVLALDPDAIVSPIYDLAARAAAHEPPLAARLPPALAARIHEVPGAWITSVSHHAARGLGRVARLLHPELFGS